MGEGGKNVEKIIFWSALFGVVAIWALFGVWAIFSLKLKWLVLVVLAILLSMANIIGYVRCLASRKEQIKSMATEFVTKKVVEHAANNPNSISF